MYKDLTKLMERISELHIEKEKKIAETEKKISELRQKVATNNNLINGAVDMGDYETHERIETANRELLKQITFHELWINNSKNKAPVSAEETREVLHKVKDIQQKVFKDTVNKMLPHLEALERILHEGRESYNAGNEILWEWHTNIRPFSSDGKILKNGKPVPLPNAPTSTRLYEMARWFGNLFDKDLNLVFPFTEEDAGE